MDRYHEMQVTETPVMSPTASLHPSAVPAGGRGGKKRKRNDSK
jgi:hypothetical protein